MRSFAALTALALLLFAASPLTPRAEAQEQATEGATMQALGGALALEAFASAGYIGAIADGIDAGVYDTRQAMVRLSGLGGGLGATVEQLDAVLKTPLSTSDRETLMAMRAILSSLKEQTVSLSKYAETRSATEAKAFRDARELTWQKISVALGLDGESAKLVAPGGAQLGLKK